MMPKPSKSIPRATTLRSALMVGLLAVSTLARCLAIEDPDRSGDEDPALSAALTTDRMERWNREVFTLDGRDSTGEIAHWVLDLDDGTRVKGDNISEAHVQHEYERGGAYEVRFSVFSEHPDQDDDAADSTGNGTARHSANTTLILVVNERQQLDERVLAASPLNESLGLTNETSPDRAQYTFKAHDNSSFVEADIHLENLDRFQDAEVTVRILDRDNESVTDANTTLGPQEEWTLRLDGELYEPGKHLVEITVTSASVRTDGELRVYYVAAGSDDDA